MKQFQLYEKWKEHERAIANDNSQQSYALRELADKMSQMMEMLSARMDSIETKIDDKFNLMEQTIGRNTSTLTAQIENASILHTEKINQLEQSFSDEIARMEQRMKHSEEEKLKNLHETAQSVDPLKSNDWIILSEKVNDMWISSYFDFTSMNEEDAFVWLEKTVKAVYKNKKELIRQSVVTNVIGILKKFEDNKKIELNGCSLLCDMIDHSDSAVHYISNHSDAIAHLMRILVRTEKKGNINTHLYYILQYIAGCNNTQKKLLKYKYLKAFLDNVFSRYKQDVFSRYKQDVFYSLVILVHLLDLPANNFPTEIAKEMIESTITSGIQRFEARFVSPNFPQISYRIPDKYWSWYSDIIITGRREQKYVCAFIIYVVSFSMRDNLKKESAVTVLERVLSDPHTDSIVRDYATRALENFKKRLN